MLDLIKTAHILIVTKIFFVSFIKLIIIITFYNLIKLELSNKLDMIKSTFFTAVTHSFIYRDSSDFLNFY